MIRTYRQAVKFLERYIPSPVKKHPGELGLLRMQFLVNLLGNPQNNYKIIHVGGTSGKGSTATITASILARKFKTGLHTSPHLVRINERIKIFPKGNDISDKDFINLINEVKPAVEKMEKSKTGAPSYFEIVTAMAFLHFKWEKVDYTVIEVGMGGEFDATNVIKPVVAVLTNVGLDHTEVLGETVEEIARDKAGIIKRGIKAVSGVKQNSVKEIIKATNSSHQITNNFLGEDFNYKIRKITDRGSHFDYLGKKSFKNLFISLMGAHQVENAVLAIRAIEVLGGIYEDQIRSGLKSAFISGRMEIVNKNPLVILDGAHNPDKMSALVGSIKTIWPGKKVKLILAIKTDKKADEMLKIMLPITEDIILTDFESVLDQGKVLSIKPEALKILIKALNYGGKIMIIKNAIKAVEKALRASNKEDIILITGSLYLLGKVKQFFS